MTNTRSTCTLYTLLFMARTVTDLPDIFSLNCSHYHGVTMNLFHREMERYLASVHDTFSGEDDELYMVQRRHAGTALGGYACDPSRARESLRAQLLNGAWAEHYPVTLKPRLCTMARNCGTTLLERVPNV